MKRLLIAFSMILTVCFTTVVAVDPAPAPRVTETILIKNIAAAEDCTVAIRHPNGRLIGSGITIIRGEEVYVWTDAHCVEPCFVYNEKGEAKLNLRIYKKMIVDDEDEGSTESITELVAYEPKLDIALLKVVHPVLKFYKNTKFYLDSKKLPKGTALILAGHYLELPCFNEGRSGGCTAILGEIGRKTPPHGQVFDLAFNTTIVGGLSGSGVWLEQNGLCAGLVCMRSETNIVWYNPIREIVKWSKANNLMWVLDENVKKAN